MVPHILCGLVWQVQGGPCLPLHVHRGLALVDPPRRSRSPHPTRNPRPWGCELSACSPPRLESPSDPRGAPAGQPGQDADGHAPLPSVRVHAPLCRVLEGGGTGWAQEQGAEGRSHQTSLPSGLPADTLQGHRDRFHEQFHRYSPGRGRLWGLRSRGCLARPGSTVTSPPLPSQPPKLLPQSLRHALLQAAHPDPAAARGTRSSPRLQPCSLAGCSEDPGYLVGPCGLRGQPRGLPAGGVPRAAPAHGHPPSTRDRPTSCGLRPWLSTSSRWW